MAEEKKEKSKAGRPRFNPNKLKLPVYGEDYKTIRIKSNNIISQKTIRRILDLASIKDIPITTRDHRKIRCYSVSVEQEKKLRDLSKQTCRSYSEIVDILLVKYGIMEDEEDGELII